MNPIVNGPVVLVLLGLLAGFVFLIYSVARRQKNAGNVFATLFGFLLLGGLAFALLMTSFAPAAPQATVITKSSTGDTAQIFPVSNNDQANATITADATATVQSLPRQTTEQPAVAGDKPRVSSAPAEITLYGDNQRQSRDSWRQHFMRLSILLGMACLIKVVADGRVGRRFGVVTRVGAGLLVCVLAVVVWQIGPIRF